MSSQSSIPAKKIKIDFQKLKAEFKKQIDEPMNMRMVFSGIFGSGKTTFLKEFFQEHTEYLPLHIFPVNYSVASNEDIFELIKYDIFYKLLDYEPNLEKMDVSSFEALAFLDGEDLINIITPFIKALSQIDKRVSGVIDSLESLRAILLKKRNELQIDQAESIKEFHKSFKIKKGNIYEHDFYTELLNILISNIEIKNSADGTQRKLVLIIDDLDRIDPEHIFRIMNVFAAHFDIESDRNKFGLSKVILACDIENIRKMFEHRYGEGVDFNGYINKFYSTRIFKLNNSINIDSSINKIFKSIDIVETYENLKILDNPNKLANIYFDMLVRLLNADNKIPIRNLTRYNNERLTVSAYKISLVKQVNNYQLVMGVVFEYLIAFFGDGTQIVEALKRSKITPRVLFNTINSTSRDINLLKFVGDLLVIVDSTCNELTYRLDCAYEMNGNNFMYSLKTSVIDGYSDLYSGKLTGFNNLRFEMGTNSQSDVDKFISNDVIDLGPLLLTAVKIYIHAPKQYVG